MPNGDCVVVDNEDGLPEQNGGKRPPLQKQVGCPLISRHVELFKHGLFVLHGATPPALAAVLLPKPGDRVTPFCGNSHRLPEKFGKHIHKPKLPIVKHVPPLKKWLNFDLHSKIKF